MYKSTDPKLHLCNYCHNEFPECTGDSIEFGVGDSIEFGEGVGGDNIIVCNGFNPKEDNISIIKVIHTFTALRRSNYTPTSHYQFLLSKLLKYERELKKLKTGGLMLTASKQAAFVEGINKDLEALIRQYKSMHPHLAGVKQ